MTRTLRGLGEKKGLPPGTLAHGESAEPNPTNISILRWNLEKWEISEDCPLESIVLPEEPWTVTWIRITGLADLEAIQKVGEVYGVHPLQLEDALNVLDRPKVEESDDGIFVSLSSITPDGESSLTEHDHVSLILRKGAVITLEEGDAPLFEAVINRMKRPSARMRRSGPDYLLYVLMDAIVDGYFFSLESIAGRIEVLEEELVTEPGLGMLERIHTLRNEMLSFRRTVWPLREMVGNLSRVHPGMLSEEMVPYLRDLYDHCIQVIETAETLREMLTGMLDIYLSSVNNKMSQVMKVLTIFSTVFMPLTFLAGIYGMNFQYMPELTKRWGYPAVLVLMFGTGIGMFAWFKKKRWL